MGINHREFSRKLRAIGASDEQEAEIMGMIINLVLNTYNEAHGRGFNAGAAFQEERMQRGQSQHQAAETNKLGTIATEPNYDEVIAYVDATGISGQEAYDQLNGRYIIRIPNYISDGPGYAGPLTIIVGGEPENIVVFLSKEGSESRVQFLCSVSG